MNRETYDALVASVEKWRQNAKATSADLMTTSAADCPLCHIFYMPRQGRDDQCHGCPVEKATGLTHCGLTPYRDVMEAKLSCNLRVARKHAQREADFLAALVPAGGPDE